MKILEAQAILRDNTAAYASRVQAGWTIADSLVASFDDLLESLTHDRQIAKAAAIALYKRTKRPRRNEDLSAFVTSLEDWREYLRAHKFT